MISYSEYSTKYKIRSTGWIQDASDLKNLHSFVSLFSQKSKYKENLIKKIEKYVEDEMLKAKFIALLTMLDTISLSYGDIVGTSPNGSRKENTVCNGIGQAAMKGQKRDFLGDWPTDNFLRWAEIMQFVKFQPISDTYEITSIGEKYVASDKYEDQKEILIQQLLMYPPATRILSLLNEKPYNKFGLGEKLGFKGEKGFTFITEELFIETYLASTSDKERKSLKSDFEGSSDKYARQICSWLLKLGLLKSYNFVINTNFKLKGYQITVKGKDFLRKASNTKKFVPFGMLSMEAKNKELSCKRRALILYAIQGKNKTITEILEFVKSEEVETTIIEIKNDLSSLINIGLNIENNNNYYTLNEKIIGLSIPKKIAVDKENEILKIKTKLKNTLSNIDADLLNLIDYSYSKISSRLFEVYVAKAYKSISEKTYLLGGPNKPDVVSCFNDFALIIDAKAYKDGFSIPQTECDKMIRYLQDYQMKEADWISKILEEKNYKSLYAFQFVSSSFNNVGNKLFSKIHSRSKKSGSVINAVNLLYLIDMVLGGCIINYETFIGNKELIFTTAEKSSKMIFS